MFNFSGTHKSFVGLYLVFIALCFLGCYDDIQIIGNVIPESVEEHQHAIEPEIDKFSKASVGIYTQRDLDRVNWADGGFGLVGKTKITYGADPSGGRTGWDGSKNMLVGRPSVLTIPIWIRDPERNCMRPSDYNEVEGFVRPLTVNIYDWKTGEPYRFHMPKWDGEPPEPIVKRLKNKHTNKDTCPRQWFYYATLPIYLKYVKTDDKTSKVLGLSAKDLGIDITFENGETLTWNVSEIYPELPPMPKFRLFED